jgi:predicted nucleotidyltransferase
MTSQIQKDLDSITAAITAKTPVEKIYLFGSYAYGEPTQDSDIDVYAVIPDTDTNIGDLESDIRYSLYKKLSLPFDLLIGQKSSFERRRKIPSLERVIFNKGEVVYGD